MVTIAVAPEDKTLSLILSSFKNLSILQSPEPASQVSQLTLSNNDTVSGTNTIASYLSTLIPTFAHIEYSDLEKAEINQWMTLTAASPIPTETIDALDDNLKFRTFLLGEKFSIADVVAYTRLKDVVASWSDEQRTGEKGHRHIVRWLDFIQNSPDIGLNIPENEKVAIDVSKVLFVPKPEEPVKEKKKEGAAEEGGKKTKGRAGVAEKAKEAGEKVKEGVEKAAAAVQPGKQGKKEKKEKPKREPPPPKEEPVISPAQIDLRIGHILYCCPHPNADSLFVSTIAMGDDPSSPVTTPHNELDFLPDEVRAKYNPLPVVRTVCSGLNGLVPIEEMQNRKVVVVANLKPVTMRGVKSAAMVLCASPVPPPGEDAHKKEFIELVSPPEGAEAGEKVFFEGYEGTPDTQLNPKKKIFEAVQPGFKTTDGLEVAFDRAKAGWTGDGEKGKAKGEGVARLVTKSGGVCKAPSLKGANVS